jgi:6-phosphogluconate dehydrogenase
MSDTPETDATEMPIDRVDTVASRPCCIVNADFARRLERERDEARQQEQIYCDNLLSMQRERDEWRAAFDKTIAELEMWRDGCIVREEDKVERDQWRECAEKLANIISVGGTIRALEQDGRAALAEFKRLKEERK